VLDDVVTVLNWSVPYIDRSANWNATTAAATVNTMRLATRTRISNPAFHLPRKPTQRHLRLCVAAYKTPARYCKTLFVRKRMYRNSNNRQNGLVC
jgi:hypothetical protein